MYIVGTEVMKSYMNMGVVNAITALEQSSNVYMFKSTIKPCWRHKKSPLKYYK